MTGQTIKCQYTDLGVTVLHHDPLCISHSTSSMKGGKKREPHCCCSSNTTNPVLFIVKSLWLKDAPHNGNWRACDLSLSSQPPTVFCTSCSSQYMNTNMSLHFRSKEIISMTLWYHPYWFGVMIHCPVRKFLVFGYLEKRTSLLRKLYNHTSEIKDVIIHEERTTWRWKPHVLLSIAFRGGKQTSNGSAVIRQTRLIILQVVKTAAFFFLPQKCQCPIFLYRLQSESFVLYLSWPRSLFNFIYVYFNAYV